MTVIRGYQLEDQISRLIEDLQKWGQVIDPGTWQGVSTEGHPEMVTKEILNGWFSAPIPETTEALVEAVKPNMPWAEDEFQERVQGEPSNPHRSMYHWPWWKGQIDEKMSHTYSERFWPRAVYADGSYTQLPPLGIRYRWGDLQDVIDLLKDHPFTRQATFPIFFPEDTGAPHGGRIPCTLHYHFLLRNLKLHMWYAIRSCDAVRHFRDDVYMAARLMQWMLVQLWAQTDEDSSRDDFSWLDVHPGMLYFNAYSFHVHRADEHLL
jgi:hypothetical protein